MSLILPAGMKLPSGGALTESLVTFSLEPGFRNSQQSPAQGSEAVLRLIGEQQISLTMKSFKVNSKMLKSILKRIGNQWR